ncbi:MAG: hypothetical protein DME59_14830 [Verrucomicrobia bacterium]|nr:MAG: hypothetical protein DME59_14830 [Verrucomicrobiota bacterium]PYL78187.1 MAG: hypothetical protein DMF26_01600 [Verrucomicrobiota bacterium]
MGSAGGPRHTIKLCMNPNENDLTRDEPLPAQPIQPREEDTGSTGREQFRRATEQVSTEMSQTWNQTKEKASRALDRTEDFLRENPVPTILGALGLGIAIGLAIRYVAPGERKREIELESPWGKFNWSVLSLPFLWPLFKSAREKSGDVMRDGVKRLKKMDVERYAKPIRKRWRAWTR